MHVTIKQEGRLEREAVVGLTKSSAQGRCRTPLTASRAAAHRVLSALIAITRPALGAAGNTPAAPMSGTRQVDAASHNRRGSQGKAGSSTTDHQPPAASGGITAPQHGGLNLLLLALLIALGLAALSLVLSRLRSQPEAAAGETARRRTEAETFRNALSPGRLRGGAEALASAIGVAALLRSASARRGVGRARSTRKRSTRLEDAPPAPRAPRAQDAPAVPLTQNKPAALPAQTEPAAPAADTGAALAAGVEAFELGAALVEKGDVTGAEAAYRRADERGHASAASNLGVLLEQRGDLAGAEAAYRRADERGDATGAFNLAGMLADRNDAFGAEAALRRADQRGDASAAFHIGTLLEARGDLFSAEAAFRRADEHDHPSAPSNLGMLLEHRGELDRAEAAYRRADGRGDAVGAFRLGALLEKRNDLSGAEAAYARAAEHGQSYVAELADAALKLLRSGR